MEIHCRKSEVSSTSINRNSNDLYLLQSENVSATDDIAVEDNVEITEIFENYSNWSSGFVIPPEENSNEVKKYIWLTCFSSWFPFSLILLRVTMIQ